MTIPKNLDGRLLPTTATLTPMPPVKPPKPYSALQKKSGYSTMSRPGMTDVNTVLEQLPEEDPSLLDLLKEAGPEAAQHLYGDSKCFSALKMRCGFTTSMLHVGTGLSYEWLIAIENGDEAADIDNILIISKVLGVTPTEVFESLIETYEQD